ncbi:MAG: hypothetical protein ABR581_09770 [Thermoleophilaceae bacterium]
MTRRDRKIMLALVPLLIVGGCWFAVLGPKRKQLSKASAALSKAEQRRDAAVSKANELEAAKTHFSGDYRAVLRLGKAIPGSLDMPALLVQLDSAARGTGIKFEKVSTGESSGSQSSTGSAQSSTQAPSSPSGNAAAGGAKAQTGLGRGTEAAGNTVNGANAKSAAADGSGGGKPAAGASAGQSGSAGGQSAQQAPGLESVPLDFSFKGSFFDLANFFHRLKRFVQVSNGRLAIRGRLMTVDSFTFTSGDSFPDLTATVKASVYLVPKAEGVSGGATPAGPSAQPATTTAAGSSSGPAAPATATATP